MRKELNFAIIGSLILLFVACQKDDGSIEPVIVSTKVVGNVTDITRNIIHENFKVIIKRYTYSHGGSLGGGGIITDVNPVDSTYTDSQGNYEIDFDFIQDPKYYYSLTTNVVDTYKGPFIDYIDENAQLEPGITNTINLDYWYASVLKLNLEVSNNLYPPLGVSNKVVAGNYYHFANEQIYSQQTNTVVYLPTKPNSEVRLLFNYSTGNSNSDYHTKHEYINTGIQDTLTYSFTIDCSSF